MTRPVRVLVLRAAGINCDEEVMHCWRIAGAEPELLHLNRLLEKPRLLEQVQIVTIPGGFSFGDDIAAGVIFARKIVQHLTEPLRAFVQRGGGILGICNGFQILVKAGLLPGSPYGRKQVTVTYNTSARFEARWVRMRVMTDHCPFLTPGATIELPVEHGEGRVVVTDNAVLADLATTGRIALRYMDSPPGYCAVPDRAVVLGHESVCTAPGEVGGQGSAAPQTACVAEHAPQSEQSLNAQLLSTAIAYPANPNGSMANMAGLTDITGRILGLMPHPDRFFERTHHPCWSSLPMNRPADGLTLFTNAVRHWRGG